MKKLRKDPYKQKKIGACGKNSKTQKKNSKKKVARTQKKNLRLIKKKLVREKC